VYCFREKLSTKSLSTTAVAENSGAGFPIEALPEDILEVFYFFLVGSEKKYFAVSST